MSSGTLPVYVDMLKNLHERVRSFIDREHITATSVFDPRFMVALLYRLKYFHFFATGITGLAIGIGVTWTLTEFVLGRPRYFEAYVMGIAANLLYNFTLHSLITFRTQRSHVRRFVLFIAYSVGMAFVQAQIVRSITAIIGVDYYLLVIAGVVLVFSLVSFIVFKLSLFSRTTSL